MFQGRYNVKRIPVGIAAGRLFGYINLNRVRKGLATVGQLAKDQISGVWGLGHPERRGETRPAKRWNVSLAFLIPQSAGQTITCT